MHVIEIAQPGGPEVLQLCERPEPQPASGEVLIRVEAAGVARADLLQRQGKYPPPTGASASPGLDVAGIIERTGDSVRTFRRGDRVCAILAGGGYAEFAIAPAQQVLPIPENWSFLEAATLPENLFTAFDNLVTRCNLGNGDTILVHGGASGLGTMAIMLSRAIGALPFATAGTPEKCDALPALGCEAAINYRLADFVPEVKLLTHGRGVDVILDMVGAPYLERNLEALAPDGRIAIVATQGGAIGHIDLRVLMSRRARIVGSTMRARSPQMKGAIRDRLWAQIWPMLPEKRWIKPVIDSTFSLAEASRAHRRLEAGSNIGKIVLAVHAR